MTSKVGNNGSGNVSWQEKYELEKQRLDWIEEQMKMFLGAGPFHIITWKAHTHYIESDEPILRQLVDKAMELPPDHIGDDEFIW